MRTTGDCGCRACINDWELLSGKEKDRLERRRDLAVMEEHSVPEMLTFTELLDRFIESCRGEVE